jgi:hypothetical protein
MGTDRPKLKKQKKAKQAAAAARDQLFPSEYEWHVHLAAKGLAERDTYPMPKSVTTPQEFYEIMAGAALEATGLRALLDRAARAERELELLRDELEQGDAKAAMGRHVAQGRHVVKGGDAPAIPEGASREPAGAARTVAPSTPLPEPANAPTAEPALTGNQPAGSAAMPAMPTRPAPAMPTRPAPATPAMPTRRAPARRDPTVTLRIPGLTAARVPGLANVRRALLAVPSGLWVWTKRTVLRRSERLVCSQCGARHPTTYDGEPCLICRTTLPAHLHHD